MAIYDTSRTIEFERKWRTTIALVAISGAIMMIYLASPLTVEALTFAAIFSLCVAALFGLFAFFFRPIIVFESLTIGPQGIRDVSVSAELIPWAAIESIETETDIDNGRLLVLKIYPGWKKKLSLTRRVRWNSGDGLRIGGDLKISLDQLFECVSAYANAYRAQAHEPPSGAAPRLVSEQGASPPTRTRFLFVMVIAICLVPFIVPYLFDELSAPSCSPVEKTSYSQSDWRAIYRYMDAAIAADKDANKERELNEALAALPTNLIGDAKERLATRYSRGDGVQKNEIKANTLYKQCAEEGDAECQRDVGAMYSYGDGVEKNDKWSFEWSKKAAEQGNAIAQDDLGVKYGDGIGVTQDWVQSYVWIYRSAKQCYGQALEDLRYAYWHMTSEQLAEAKSLIGNQ